jgi:hypothetical protein
MSTLAVIGVVGALLASALHVAFWWLESIRFRRQGFYERSERAPSSLLEWPSGVSSREA